MEKFYSSKTLLKVAVGGDACAAYPTSPLDPPLVCIITKDGLKLKRYVLNKKYRRQLRHDCCEEVKGMLSSGTAQMAEWYGASVS